MTVRSNDNYFFSLWPVINLTVLSLFLNFLSFTSFLQPTTRRTMEALPVEMRTMILDHLSNFQLQIISLVNKLLNHEARSLMSTRANLNADLYRPACQNVLPFLSDLKEMNVIPFSGIQIRWKSEDHSKLCPRLHKIFNPPDLHNMDRVAWKRLSVSVHGRRHRLPKTCPVLQLVQKILTDYSAVLEELELKNHLKLLQFIQEVTQDRQFPQLKILKLQGMNSPYDVREIKKTFIKEMLPRAPNLRELHQDGFPSLSKNPLEGISTSAVIVSNYDSFNPAYHEFAEGFTGTVKLKAIELYYVGNYFSMERFKRTTPRILQSSFDTLHSIRMNLVFLVPLMAYSGLCLKNVKDFSASIDYDHLELTDPRIFSLLKQFDFTRVFPKLDQVRAVPCYDRIPADHITEFVNNAAALEEPPPDRAMNIKQLSIAEYSSAKAIALFAGMFPNIATLFAAINFGEEQVPYSSIWEYWPGLKEIYGEKFSSYTESTSTRNENLDRDFCGIFPAEVALLREQDDEYLRAVHIVPVMPSITCLRTLRTIRIVRRYDKTCRSLEEAMDAMFSKVTALIVFHRCPNLFVVIQTNSQKMLEALNPVWPYAKVQLTE